MKKLKIDFKLIYSSHKTLNKVNFQRDVNRKANVYNKLKLLGLKYTLANIVQFYECILQIFPLVCGTSRR